MEINEVYLLFLLMADVSLTLSDTTFLIIPNETTPCLLGLVPYRECLTLEQFAEKYASTGNVSANITLDFLSGMHDLFTDLVINNTDTFSIRTVSIDSPTIVRCHSSATLVFTHVSMLEIVYITISGCGRESGPGEGVSFTSQWPALLMEETKLIQLFHFEVYNSTGIAVKAINCSSLILANTTISGSNEHGLYMYQTTLILRGGNFLLHNNDSAVKVVFSTIYLLGLTMFIGNFANRGGAINSFQSSIIASGKTIFLNNSAINDGGAICSDGEGTIFITGESEFTNNKAFNSSDGLAVTTHGGGAIYASNATTLSISGNSSFQFNEAGFNGGAIFAWGVSNMTINGTVNFTSNTVKQNKGGAICAWVHEHF